MSQASAHTGAGRQSLVADNHLVILGGESEGTLTRARQIMSQAIVQTQQRIEFPYHPAISFCSLS